jgi:hypothetical protein
MRARGKHAPTPLRFVSATDNGHSATSLGEWCAAAPSIPGVETGTWPL